MSAVPATCDLCDAHKSRADGLLRVLPPVYRDFGGASACAGRIATVRCLDDNSRVREAVMGPGDGRVLVVDGAGSLRRALVGGNLAVAAHQNGWVGLIGHGAVRDVAELAAVPIVIRALAACPMPTDRQDEGLHGVALHLHGFWLHPGEWLCADADGTVVLPEAP